MTDKIDISAEDIKEVLRLHGMWTREEEGGERAYLYRANLSGANLNGADLSNATLSRATLYRANLSGANLNGANLSNAYLNGANLSSARGIIRVGPASDGYEFFGVQRDGAVWIKAGCRWFTANDARKHWQETRADTPLGRERMRFVDLIESHLKGGKTDD